MEKTEAIYKNKLNNERQAKLAVSNTGLVEKGDYKAVAAARRDKSNDRNKAPSVVNLQQHADLDLSSYSIINCSAP